ncbi:MAG: efflux RND transporter periplasmic adaptor subunit [Prevotellaceae bacterium]|jgi:HlyD family secretion protein|nr:efflux RND transporter periplasmic adaptor subunit [Prevotellaceae bacterium]
MKKLKWFIFAIVALIIILLIGKSAGWFGKPEIIQVVTEKVQRHTIIESIPANGKIQPVTEVKISPDVSGEIVELNVKEGQIINRGDLLIKIKPEVYISMLDRMKATLNSSQARLEQIQAQLVQNEQNFNRTKKLYEDKVVPESEYETVESQYNVAKKQLEAAKYDVLSAQASLDEAQENLNKTSIFSPMNGTISLLSVKKGERVVGTSQMAGTEMLRIANLDEMEAQVSVNENDIVRVKLNDTALIEVDAYPGKIFKGIVTEIANSAAVTTTADQVTNFQVKIFMLPESYTDLKLPNNPNPFRPGMSTSVYIQTTKRADVLAIPIQSITTRGDLVVARADTTKTSALAESSGFVKAKEMVFVAARDSVRVAEIQTGIQDNNFIEITSGLNENDEVVTLPYTAIAKRLSNGSKITKTTADKLTSR